MASTQQCNDAQWDHYDLDLNGQTRRVHRVQTQRDAHPPAGLLEPESGRPAQTPVRVVADFALTASILLLPLAVLHSLFLALVLGVIALSLLLSVHFALLARVMTALGPPDQPHVIAVIKLPDKFFCPRCGDERADEYCSNCGVDVRQEYRKAIRKLAYYVVDATDSQRRTLEASLQMHIDQIADQQRQQIEYKLATLERQYVMEIARQHKQIKRMQRRRLPPPGVEIGATYVG